MSARAGSQCPSSHTSLQRRPPPPSLLPRSDYCGEFEGIHYCYDGHGSYGSSGYGEPDWPIRARVWHISAMGATIQTYKRLDPLAGGVPEPSQTIDLQTIYSSAPVSRLAVSLTDGSPACPAGFAADHDDLNFGAGGRWAYLCVERATAASGGRFVSDVRAVVGGGECPAGFAAAGGNVKEGTAAAAAVRICFKTAGPGEAGRVATDVRVEQGRGGAAPRCADGAEAATGDLSAGVGEQSIVCVTWAARTAEVEARGAYPASTRLPADAAFSTALAADKSDIAAAKGPVRRRSKPAH